jgi:hypothetical protein
MSITSSVSPEKNAPPKLVSDSAHDVINDISGILEQRVNRLAALGGSLNVIIPLPLQIFDSASLSRIWGRNRHASLAALLN